MFQKTLALNDFYFAGNGRDWPLGNIQMLGKSNAMAMKGEEPKLTKPRTCQSWVTGSPSTATATSTSPTRQRTMRRLTACTTN